MFKKRFSRSKSGLSHVDWAMSLAIFLLYLAWFFIFVKPVLAPATNMDVLLDILDDGARDFLFEDVDRVRVFVPGDFVADYEPIGIPYIYSWDESEISISADHFVIDDGKLFFLANLSNSSDFRIYHPFNALKETVPRQVMADDERTTYGTFNAYFVDAMIDRITFLGEQKLSGFSVLVDDTDIGGEGEFTNQTFLAKYKRSGDAINISSYLFAENRKVYSYIAPSDHRQHSIELSFIAYNYSEYYFDATHSGSIQYTIPSCRSYTSDFMDIYGDSDGLFVYGDRNLSFMMCTNGTSMLVSIGFDLAENDEAVLGIMLHEGGVDSVIDYPVKPIVGVKESMSVVSSKKVSFLRGRSYSYQKQVLEYPAQRDFNITVESSIISASYGIVQPDMKDIYARKLEGVIIDENYLPNRALLTLSVW